VTAPPTFRLSGRQELCEFEETDAPELHALIDQNRTELAKWIQWAPAQTAEQTLAFIRRARARADDNTGHEYAIVNDGRIVGVVGFPVIDRANRSAAIGYWLDEGHQRRGTMTTAVAALAAHAFDAWQLNRLEIRIDVDNVRSRSLAERLGFQLEGIARQAYRVGDRLNDDAVYSMLASDPARRLLASAVQRGDEDLEPAPGR
jgi:ribosomal-protein-serine acetyltransferase